MLPNFLIIGAPRCGTTYLVKNLREHPDIFLAHEGEDYSTGDLHFFDVSRAEGAANHGRGLPWYAAHFTAAQGCRAVGEKTADYLADPAAPALIRETLGPHVKLVVLCRNPILRAYSHYRHIKAYLPVGTTFRQLLAEPERAPDALLLESGLYYQHLQRYAAAFSREQMHIIPSETLFAQPGATFAALFRFLGVDASFQPPHAGQVINRSYDANLAHYLALAAVRVKRAAPGLFDLLRQSRLTGAVRDLISRERGLAGAPPAPAPADPLAALAPEDIDYLRAYYRKDVERLSALVGDDLARLWFDRRP